MNSEDGIVFFADGILARTFKSAADRLSDACLVIEKKNFFEDLHEIVFSSEHRLCQWSAVASFTDALVYLAYARDSRPSDFRARYLRSRFWFRAGASKETRYRIDGKRQNHGV